MNNDEILFSFVLTRLLFADDYLESLNKMDEKCKRYVFESVIANIKADVFFTKFDENVTDRLYNILNYFRGTYKDDNSFNKINDAIDTLNKQDNLLTVYPVQFDSRFETIFNKKQRRLFLKNNLEVVKSLVQESILNDLPFYYDIEHLKGSKFNETYGNNLIYISNATHLINTFPEILGDNVAYIKLYNLFINNMDSYTDNLINNPFIYAGSCLTLKKMEKICKKNK